MPIANVEQAFALVDCAVTVGGNIRYTQIDTQDTFNINWLGCFNIADSKQIPFTIHECQIGFATPCLKQFFVALAAHEWDCLSSVQCPYRDGIGIVVHNTIIVGDGT